MDAIAGFHLIPVLDLLHGQTVHAVRGQRRAYRPLVSRLAAGSDPVTIARALLATAGAAAGPLYVADLDGIQRGAPQVALLARLLDQLPAAELWLDAGFADRDAAAALASALALPVARWRPVYGSESLRDLASLAALHADPRAILSLDSRGGQALDPAGCWQQPALWPATVIVMTLDRVGSGSGPDLTTLARLRTAAPGRRWFGAGGIRDAADLRACAAAGADGWLVASALHDGRLGTVGP